MTTAAAGAFSLRISALRHTSLPTSRSYSCSNLRARRGSFRYSLLSCHRNVFTSVVTVSMTQRGKRALDGVSGAVPEADLDLITAKSGFLDPDVLHMWRMADAVCFDVDSTVCEDEGIDELAAFCGAGEAVAAWTTRAMSGSVPFEIALAERLNLFKPSASDLTKLLATKAPRLSPGIQDLVGKLLSKGKQVYLISGGFRQMIEPAAELLGISDDKIYANTLLFEENGDFAGFDPSEPTSRSGGKAKVIEKIKKEFGYKTLVMIGDGATDLEARRPGGADLFICYGGVTARPKVVQGSDAFVTTFSDLLNNL